MQRLTGFFCLFACLFMMPLTATAQDRMPDLFPVVVDANHGYMEVRNIGGAMSEPSQLYVVCSMIRSGKPTVCCATGLHLPGFIEKWNTLPVVYLAEDPNASTTKDMAEQIRAAMPQCS